jgi:hypothetical protein
MQNYPDSIKQERLRDTKASTEKLSKIKQTGFIAQEVEIAAKKSGYDFNGVHAPENSTDNWSMSYEKLVVPLVKAVQELDEIQNSLSAEQAGKFKIQNDAIALLQKENNELKERLAKLEAIINANSTTNYKQPGLNNAVGQETTNLSFASLEQNIPNPFTNSTTISYYLPVINGNAYINFYDASGKILKSVKLTGDGKGSIEIKANELPSGVYKYALIAGGVLVATKQMILAR